MKGFWFKVFMVAITGTTLGVAASAALVCYELGRPGLESVLLFCVLQAFFLAYNIVSLRKFSGGMS